MKLWHCQDARSLRALWALEEMGLPYELEVMPFPPRFLHAGYLEVNPLGTVPYFVDGDHALTESSGICHYLVERYQQYDFGGARGIDKNHKFTDKSKTCNIPASLGTSQFV